MHITELEFASLLSYCPNGDSPNHQRSKEVRTFIKTDAYVQDPDSPARSIPMSEWIAQTMANRRTSLPFNDFFQPNTVLVPTPRSSLLQPNALWIPDRIANELLKKGFGSKVVQYLRRIKALPKSAFSNPEDRPKVAAHFESLSVQGTMTPPEEVILVDDIITRGATLMGAANRLLDVFPQTRVRALAIMRTISNPSDFEEIYKPCVGRISYRSAQDDTLRRP